MKLYHVADVHLGRRRLDGKLPDRDFADALAWIVEQAVAEKPDAFLIAGDLFDSPHIQPHHLRQAQDCLRPLLKARIPVLAIEGNHDLVSLNATEASWLQYLAEDGLLHLLRIPFTAAGPLITPWDAIMRRGSYVELGGVRFVGAGYLGAGTPRRLKAILDQLDNALPTILLLHAGPEYFVGEGGGFSSEDLEAIQRKVVYLALGHIHKPMIHGQWACNPGSPEHCELSEVAYDRRPDGTHQPRGYARITLDPRWTFQPAAIEVLSNPRRPCFRLKLDCTLLANLDALQAAAANAVRAQAVPQGGAVEFMLTGELNVSRLGFDPEALSAALEKQAGLSAVAFNCSGITAPGNAMAAGESAAITREELERQAIRALIEEKQQWASPDQAEAFANLCYELKQDVQTGKLEETVVERILNNPLTNQVAEAPQI